MNIHRDFQELLQLLADHHVNYMIVGGYAVTYHGFARLTKDLDIFYGPSQNNIAALKAALLEFGFTSNDLDGLAFAPGEIVTFGAPPLRVDLLNEIDGVNFDDSFPHRIQGKYGDAPAYFIAREQLILNKRASGRTQDLADLEMLE